MISVVLGLIFSVLLGIAFFSRQALAGQLNVKAFNMAATPFFQLGSKVGGLGVFLVPIVAGIENGMVGALIAISLLFVVAYIVVLVLTSMANE